MITKNFLYYFPTPSYLKMPAVGVAVADRFIRFVELEGRAGDFKVKRYGERPLPDGTEGATAARDPKVVEILRELRRELGTPFVNVALPEEKSYLFKTELPAVEKSAIRPALELRLEEFVPIKLSEAIFDYDVIEHRSHAAAGHLDLSVSVLPTAVANDYLNLFTEAGFTPLSFEIEARAAARAVVGKDDRRTFMLVNIGRIKTGLAIVSDGTVHFTSTVPVGGDIFTQAIKKHRGVSFEEAERIKKETGIVTTKKNIELFFSLMSTLSVFRDEMNRLAGYWSSKGSREGEGRIDAIILSGSEVGLPGFEEYFMMSMKIPVETANVWVNVNSFDRYIPPIPRISSLDYAAAIGLALLRRI